MGSLRKSVAIAATGLVLLHPLPARAAGQDAVRVNAGNSQRPPASEFYTTDSAASVLVKVNIWGEVSRPGMYFLPETATVIDAVSSAGGANSSADLESIRVLRGSGSEKLSALTGPVTVQVRENDMIFVDRSVKADLPLIYASVSTVMSLVAFYYVFKSERAK